MVNNNILLLALASSIGFASATVRHYYDNITYIEHEEPDTSFNQSRRYIGVNGVWPPPARIIDQGDVALVHVTNLLNETITTVHHHGIYFRGHNSDDGAMMTQCGIPPGSTYMYTIDTNNQSGTYWYHSHVTGQIADGLRAPFVIRDQKNFWKKKIDDEYTIIFSDWYDDLFWPIVKSGVDDPEPNNIIMYAVSSNGTQLPGYNKNTLIPFQTDKTYRLRFINAGSISPISLWLDDHDLELIELDGVAYQPEKIKGFSLAIAQRVSVLVKTKGDSSQNYKFHAQWTPDAYGTVFDNVTTSYEFSAIYDHRKPFAPSTNVNTSYYFTEREMLSWKPIDKYKAVNPDKSLTTVIGSAFDPIVNDTVNVFDNTPYDPPLVPEIISAMTMGDLAFDKATYGNHSPVEILPYGIGVHYRIINNDSDPHPIHLHGHQFQVLGHGTVDGVNTILKNQTSDHKNPPRRDTVLVPSNTYVDIGFETTNEGVWHFHCHVEFHYNLGRPLIVAPDVMQKNQTLPPQLLYQCMRQAVPVTNNGSSIYVPHANEPGVPYDNRTAPITDKTTGETNITYYDGPDAAALGVYSISTATARITIHPSSSEISSAASATTTSHSNMASSAADDAAASTTSPTKHSSSESHTSENTSSPVPTA